MASQDAAEWMECHHVALYIAAIGIGLASEWAIPGSHQLKYAITPVLALQLFATFLAVSFSKVGASFRDGRFLAAAGVLNFVLVPWSCLGSHGSSRSTRRS